jgi:hypothetical protein
LNTRRKTLLIAVILAVAFTIPIFAEAAPDILWDQPFQAGGKASQYNPDLGGGLYSADDFGNSSPWNIETIIVELGLVAGFSLHNAQNLNWFIYTDAAGVPAGNPEAAGELWSHSCLPGDPEVAISGTSPVQVTLDIMQAQGSPLYLPGGRYWLVFYPSMDYGPSFKYCYWGRASTANLAICQWISPIGLWGHSTSWTPSGTGSAGDHDLAFRLEGSREPPPSNVRYLHSINGLFNLTDPAGTQWHELWPFFCKQYYLSSWNDTSGDGMLSYCDRIDMYEKPDGEVKCYHVEEVTITLNVTPEIMGDPMYIELEGGYNVSVLKKPVCTQWHEIYPVFCRAYHLSNWDEGPGNGVLDAFDLIELTNRETQEPTWWRVEEVAVDIIVTLEPPPVGGEAYPVSKASLLAPCIALAAVLIAGDISWYIWMRRKTKS